MRAGKYKLDRGSGQDDADIRYFWIREHDLPVERVIADVIAEFERDHPQVKIDFEGMDQTIHREQKLKSEMVTGNPPDIIALFGGAGDRALCQCDAVD